MHGVGREIDAGNALAAVDLITLLVPQERFSIPVDQPAGALALTNQYGFTYKARGETRFNAALDSPLPTNLPGI
jgi:hypothetical protein